MPVDPRSYRVPPHRWEFPMRRLTVTLDGNKAAASIADQLNEVIVIYPITPASPMGEWAN
jgi:hypothetical protein